MLHIYSTGGKNVDILLCPLGIHKKQAFEQHSSTAVEKTIIHLYISQKNALSKPALHQCFPRVKIPFIKYYKNKLYKDALETGTLSVLG